MKITVPDICQRCQEYANSTNCEEITKRGLCLEMLLEMEQEEQNK